ncbi:hypothetical protein DFQ27_006097 [Actinomortierella ambigua]|uniref:SCP2 domain-containing protein n=1 Tax=Actinomortierella ambigua TaxID=1343610 RepID=A0A9P6Q046_9FUNG|nr:hypothetical protein DFQ26_006569 [Actinomortierella ambigua]KAG0255728.1 hypothetical protein DFQ27_006097 [Actinomortierella ambigua]
MSAIEQPGFKSSALLVQIDEQLKSLSEADRKAQVTRVKGVFQFNVKNKDGKVATWTFDLKNGVGAMHKGTVQGLKPDITIDVSDDDFVNLAEGKANGQKLFMSGKIKVKGAIMMATKLETVLRSADHGIKPKL